MAKNRGGGGIILWKESVMTNCRNVVFAFHGGRAGEGDGGAKAQDNARYKPQQAANHTLCVKRA
jgi:hypothetical protein